MNIKTKQFQILTDINLVWNFMTDIYDPYFANGAAAPFFEYARRSAIPCESITFPYTVPALF